MRFFSKVHFPLSLSLARQACVLMKNLSNNCEWVWPKEKFLQRKIDITEMLDDLKDDGKINREKFKVKTARILQEIRTYWNNKFMA